MKSLLVFYRQTNKFLKRNITLQRFVRLVMYVLLLDLAVVFLYPFFYMIVTSIKSPTDIMDTSVVWIVNKLYFRNYELAFKSLDYVNTLLRTILYCLVTTVGHILACSFTGYGFARFKFKGKGFMFFLLILAMVIPVQTIIVPQYLIYTKLGMANGFMPLILPVWFGYGLRGALFIFLFRQFYLSLPKALEDAAAVDGCSPVKTFFRVAFPASTSPIIVSTVLSVVWHWNEYYEPGIYLSKESQKLLPMLLPNVYSLMNSAADASLLTSTDASLYTEGTAMAATFMVVLPVLIFYLVFQKQFRKGIETSGITGE